MIRRPRRLVVLLMCAAAVGSAAGCGGGGSTTPKTTASPPASNSNPAANVALPVRLERSIAACRHKMLHDQYIPSTDRATAAADCEGYKTGHLAPLYAIVEPACETQVRDTVPASKQAAALTACKKVFAAAAG